MGDMVQVDEQMVRRVAWIMGPQSAAAQAIADFENRSARGEAVAFYRQGAAWLVGPNVSLPNTTREGEG